MKNILLRCCILLVERACNELRKTHRKARTITLKLRYTDLKRVSRSITLDAATNLDEAVFRAAINLLQSELAAPCAYQTHRNSSFAL